MADESHPKHDHAILNFPKGFLWGSATSAFQVEGDNTNADWYRWEMEAEVPEKRSGKAINQYHLYEEDFKLAKSLGHNTHRLSIEWSRIEPREGEFDTSEIEHYKNVLKSLKDQGLTVMLTLHHFTNPIWFADKGGWLNFKSSTYFERFLKRVLPEIKDYVDLWITVNEPGGYALDAYGRGKFPPNIKKGVVGITQALWNLSQAHKKAYKLIHQLDKNAKVGLSHNVTSFQALHPHRLTENLAVWGLDVFNNHVLYKLTGIKTHDFLALNYYYNGYINLSDKTLDRHVEVTKFKKEVSDMGWEVRPEGLFDNIMDFSDYHLPIYITENGIASVNDDRRVRFLLNFLKEIYHAISAGVDVKGYYYWSLLDNYEWVEGFSPRFGLVEVDPNTFRRIPKPSAFVYKEIIKNNGIPHHLLKLLGHGIKVEEVVSH